MSRSLVIGLRANSDRGWRPRCWPGAGKSDADVRALMDLAEATPNLEVTLRACRYPHRVKLWKQLPSGLFTSYEEHGVCHGAPPKEVRLAETRTLLKGEAEANGLARSSAGKSYRVPRKTAGIRCIPVIPRRHWSPGKCLRSFVNGNSTSRDIGYRYMTSI